MNRIEAPKDGRTEQLVDTIMTTIWLKGVLKQYTDLPKQTGRERKVVKNLVTKTAAGLLQNPQDISIADKTWQRHEACENQAQKLEEPFSELVRKERLELIKDKWEYVKPEQLAGLVRICSNKDESQKSARESAEDLLKNYFEGSRSSNQQINVYYNFVSGVLDLAGEDEAFKEGMKIAIHGTDILPRNPSLIEQEVLISLPYKEERAFKKLVVATHVTNQIVFMSAQDFTKYLQENKSFMATDENAKKEWDRKQKMVVKQIGGERVKELNDAMIGFSQILEEGYLTEERKQSLKNTWPYNLAFDEDDPLNQKFKRVFA